MIKYESLAVLHVIENIEELLNFTESFVSFFDRRVRGNDGYKEFIGQLVETISIELLKDVMSWNCIKINFITTEGEFSLLATYNFKIISLIKKEEDGLYFCDKYCYRVSSNTIQSFDKLIEECYSQLDLE
jgi:hypothetical protein